MATSTNAFDATTVTAANTGSAATVAATQPYDNTHQVVIYNSDATHSLLVKVRTAVVGAANPVASSVNIPTQSSFTLTIGTVAQRPPYGTGAGQTTIYYSSSDAAATVTGRITYVNSFTAS